MKILHVIPSISPLQGGPSHAVMELAKAQNSIGLKPTIISTDYLLDNNKIISSHRFQIKIFRSLKTPIRKINSYGISLSLIIWLIKNISKYDLIHFHSLFSFSTTFGMIVSRLLKKNTL